MTDTHWARTWSALEYLSRRPDPPDPRHRRAVQGSERAARSRRCPRSAARRSSISSSRPPPAPASRSSSPRSGSRADTVNVASAGLVGVSKGETLVDTARNLEAMRIDMVVIRHHASGLGRIPRPADPLQRHQRRRRQARAPDPGAARHAHAARQVREDRGPQGRDLRRRAAQPRGAGATSGACTKLGAEVAVCGPASLLPRDVRDARRHGHSAHRGRDPVGRRAQRPAAAAGADDGGLHPVAARIQPGLRRSPRRGWRRRRRTW